MGIQENKQAVMEGYRRFQSGDIRKLLDLYHDDAEWIGPELAFVPFSGAFHGKTGIAQFFAKLDEAVHADRFEPAEFIADGDKVVVTGFASWLAKPTGRRYDSDWVHVFTLRDGKVSRFEAYYDTAATEKAFRPEQTSQASAAAQLHH
ncbi:nuclear transport factor 2 family protein [Janthinobacterium sp.]|uniref:nuclear transport factor 2 family protein n=1 Tax=Janthinobacterium sp. TaxID=1871054 RepID=UPI00293D2A15|nr:nuclear transport factor 2 family protein [Janthinobacterium sp.]